VGLGPVLGVPLAAVTAALGAVQIAAIAAAPLPEYKYGRENGPAEYAIVGDGGKREVVMGDDGVVRVTSSKPQLIHLEKGDMVFPSISDFKDFIRMTALPEYTSSPAVVSVDLSPLIAEQKAQGVKLEQAIKSQNTLQIFNTKRGMQSVLINTGGKTILLNQKFNA
jgi:hypothetical protein